MKSRQPLLTRREEEVLDLVVKGLSNREIAKEFYLSPRTVTSHIQNIFGKVGVNNRTALAHWARQQQQRGERFTMTTPVSNPWPEGAGPYFRTVVAFEVLTRGEAFNGPWEMLTDADSVTQLDRLEPEEVSPAIFERLVALHDLSGTGYDVSQEVLSKMELQGGPPADAPEGHNHTGGSTFCTTCIKLRTRLIERLAAVDADALNDAAYDGVIDTLRTFAEEAAGLLSIAKIKDGA